MIHRKTKTKLFEPKKQSDKFECIRIIAANKLLTYYEHHAGRGSVYLYFGGLKIRFANHVETSKYHSEPDYNIVKRRLNESEIEAINQEVDYPEYCKQKAFAMHVNQTIPKLKKILPPECYKDILENEYYFNTFTKVILVKEALEYLDSIGITERRPVRQETISEEDYAGDDWYYNRA